MPDSARLLSGRGHAHRSAGRKDAPGRRAETRNAETTLVLVLISLGGALFTIARAIQSDAFEFALVAMTRGGVAGAPRLNHCRPRRSVHSFPEPFADSRVHHPTCCCWSASMTFYEEYTRSHNPAFDHARQCGHRAAVTLQTPAGNPTRATGSVDANEPVTKKASRAS